MASTPRINLRATPSTITSRSAPAIAPAAQTYEPLVRAELSQRLARRIFVYSAVLSWLLTAAWSSWSKGGMRTLGVVAWLLNPVQPTTLLLAVANWAAGVVPVVVLRKVYLTATPSAAASPSAAVRGAVARKGTGASFATYACSAISMALLHVLLSSTYEPASRGDPKLGVFGRSKKYPLHLNGRFVFLVVSQSVLAFSYLIRNVMLDRFAIRSSPDGTPPSRLAHFISIPVTLITALLFTLLASMASTLLFASLRSLVLPVLLRTPLLRTFLHPFTALFLRSRAGYTIALPMRNAGLLVRAFLLALTTSVGWEFADGLFDTYVSAPIAVSHLTADPALTLVSGIGASYSSPATADYYRHCAFRELAQLAKDDSPAASAARTALFGDQKHNPTMWAALVREALLLLGQDYQRLLRRGAEPAPAPPAPVPVPSPDPRILPAPTKVLQTPIFRTDSPSRSPLKTLVDGLAADGPLSRAVDATAARGGQALPELFRSVGAADALAKIEKEAQAVVHITAPGPVPRSGKEVGALVSGAVARVHSVAVGYAPAWARDSGAAVAVWWTRERLGRVVEKSLPRRELDVLAIEVLAHLVCASLEEDRYGVVQRDIPRVLEALASFLGAAEAYQAEIAARAAPLTPEEVGQLSAPARDEWARTNEEVAQAGAVVGVVGDALKEGVVRIVKRFGDKLTAFKFPPAMAAKLQGYVDYS